MVINYKHLPQCFQKLFAADVEGFPVTYTDHFWFLCGKSLLKTFWQKEILLLHVHNIAMTWASCMFVCNESSVLPEHLTVCHNLMQTWIQILIPYSSFMYVCQTEMQKDPKQNLGR